MNVYIENFRVICDNADVEKALVLKAVEKTVEMYKSAGVALGIGMGVVDTRTGAFPDMDAPNPMELDLEDEVPRFIPCCPGINPVRLLKSDPVELQALKRLLGRAGTVGIKLYAGYYPLYVHDGVYEAVCRLAAEYGLPLVIHSGITYSERGLLKYSHPLQIDELAVRHPEINIVVCHMGDPWVMDTAVLISKNTNVYADPSGLMVLDAAGIGRRSGNPDVMGHFKRALAFQERYDRFLFGTDWPLAPVGAYVGFVGRLIPEECREMVFCSNALRVFPKLAGCMRTKAESGVYIPGRLV